ncbi:hypothetical protein DICVIV_08226 [Dictyocaulus viviparus]|uniref:THAP4-like heme-binding domain-containing protein n=1 Tax=Dictyocaulus viviparus TaxID=29172 RepID=A0A0D8XPL0_DICVI|nr:hypothetical protein DICVIV_08226 [Dictyocaulus viviparus]
MRTIHIMTIIITFYYVNGQEYDLRRLPPQLLPLAFLVGKWRSEHDGKAIFPTIPKFTYGEEVDISIPDDALQAQKALNYTYAKQSATYLLQIFSF